MHTNLPLALEHAFRNERTWRRFVRHAYASGYGPLRVWLEQPDPTWWAHNRTRAQRVLWQLQQLDAGVPHTIQSIETALDETRRRLRRRKFVLRNRKRTNLMLGLITVNQNGWDDERAYAREIRLQLTERAGIAPPRHLITDPAGMPSLWP